MMKQKVMVADSKSGIDMAVVVPPALFTAEVKKPPLMPRGYITISKKKLLHKIEINSETRINAWVESMRASSPTAHQRSTHDQTSWMVRHPFSLNMFDEITNASKGKQIVMFLDYDGTLSPSTTLIAHTCPMRCERRSENSPDAFRPPSPVFKFDFTSVFITLYLGPSFRKHCNAMKRTSLPP